VSEQWPQDAFPGPHQRSGGVPEFDAPPAVRKEVLSTLSLGNRTLQMDVCDEWLSTLQAEAGGFASNYSFGMYSWAKG